MNEESPPPAGFFAVFPSKCKIVLGRDCKIKGNLLS
jgi:hypothetical protein